CGTGSPVCSDGTADAPAGTSCGASQVCNGSGGCVACTAGSTCTTNPSPCRQGVTSCATGTQTCADGPMNDLPGTACGSNLVCDGAGACVSCSMGASCTMNPSPCREGTIGCATGGPVCNDAAAARPNGTSCGTNQVCSGGACVACTAGLSCNPGGNACALGSTTCGTGTSVCTFSANIAAGTSCGANLVCDGMGGCVACVAGQACSPGGNLCRTGTIACGGGAPVCTASGNVAAGTSCGSNQVCDGNGACVACAAGMACSTGNPCVDAAIVCTSGAPVCTVTGNRPNNEQCGAPQYGMFGACSYASPCTNSGSRTRPMTTYACQSGVCQASAGTDTDTAGCARNTNFFECALPTSCSGCFCNTDCVRVQYCTSYWCEAEVCVAHPLTEESCLGSCHGCVPQ
ncbi:MAG: hypothetical protein JNK82_03450, partial [Myxococcaceae bacterium]|nr:hypothetical protein [Myxococcaceae bacterium]